MWRSYFGTKATYLEWPRACLGTGFSQLCAHVVGGGVEIADIEVKAQNEID
jgi:hypothetical protein